MYAIAFSAFIYNKYIIILILCYIVHIHRNSIKRTKNLLIFHFLTPRGLSQKNVFAANDDTVKYYRHSSSVWDTLYDIGRRQRGAGNAWAINYNNNANLYIINDDTYSHIGVLRLRRGSNAKAIPAASSVTNWKNKWCT